MPKALPTVICQVFTSPGELVRWMVLMPNGTTEFLTTTEVMQISRATA